MTDLSRLWSWLTVTTRSTVPFCLCLLSAVMLGAIPGLDGHPLAIGLIILASSLTISSALDLTAREATANERARWAVILLDALKEDRALEITVTNMHVGREEAR